MSTHLDDILSVGYINSVAVVISMTDIEAGLRILSLILASAYTAYKFYKAINAK